jgi:hypothetical protein
VPQVAPRDEAGLLIAEAEARLERATARLAALEERLARVEVELSQLEHEVHDERDAVAETPWPSVRLGLAAPLSVLAAALFFDQGVWPLGLLACVVTLVQALTTPGLNRSAR